MIRILYMVRMHFDNEKNNMDRFLLCRYLIMMMYMVLQFLLGKLYFYMRLKKASIQL